MEFFDFPLLEFDPACALIGFKSALEKKGV
jgi:hypothetical protein